MATTHGQLAVLQASESIPTYATLAVDAIEIEWRGLALTVCSLRQLVAMKAKAARPVDLYDLTDLAEAHDEPE